MIAIKYEIGQKVHNCTFNGSEQSIKGKSGRRIRFADFICSCGNIFNASINAIASGATKSCGCYIKGINAIKYNSGEKIGECIYLNDVGVSNDKFSCRLAEFICPLCSNIFIARIHSIKSLAIRSCGCLRTAMLKERVTTHGQSGTKTTPEYKAWTEMIERCTNENAKYYHRYGGRGIKICERWRNSFEAFFQDMGERTSSNHSLDRFPNNDGNYEKSNCRWATPVQQCNNRSNTIYITHNGETKTLMEWSRLLNIRQHTIYGRLKRNNFIVNELILRPTKKTNRWKQYL